MNGRTILGGSLLKRFQKLKPETQKTVADDMKTAFKNRIRVWEEIEKKKSR